MFAAKKMQVKPRKLTVAEAAAELEASFLTVPLMAPAVSVNANLRPSREDGTHRKALVTNWQ